MSGDVPVYMRREGLNPSPELDRLRAEEPVSRARLTVVPFWLVTRYDDVREVFRDHTRFSSAMMGPPPGVKVPHDPDMAVPAGLLQSDPPEHSRLRGILTPRFTAKALEKWEPRVQSIVNERLDALASAGPGADLMTEFAEPVPFMLLCELLGIAYADGAEFLRVSAPHLDLDVGESERMAAVIQSHAMMKGFVKRQRDEPGQGLIAELIREHGDTFSDDELAGMMALVILGGQGNTANMLGLGLLLLLENPEQLALVRDRPEIGADAVEEIIRYLSVVPTSTPRTVRHDTTVGGQPVKAGELLLCSLTSANRDEALAAGLDRFDVTREQVAHVAFGHGVHYCVGAALARLVLRVAYPSLLRRFPSLRLAIPKQELKFRTHSVNFGVYAVPLEW